MCIGAQMKKINIKNKALEKALKALKIQEIFFTLQSPLVRHLSLIILLPAELLDLILFRRSPLS